MMHNHDLDYVYDEECYPNFFSCSIKHHVTGQRWRYEISEWKNEGQALYNALVALQFTKARMIGFNSLGYDYPLLHLIMQMRGFITHEQLWEKSSKIIDSGWGNNFHTIWPNDRFIIQIDLMKVHHFDNVNKATSLKVLEFDMNSYNIKDLPYPPGTTLTREEANNVLIYNDHDVDETEKFLVHSYPSIDFRVVLSEKYGKDFLNHNDTKIGKDYFAMELEKSGIPIKIGGKINQTKRDKIIINDIILSYVKFERPELNEVLNFFRNQVVTEKDKKGLITLKGIFKGLNAVVDGFQFDFGSGGLHGSIKNSIISRSSTHKLFDVDVASYYPNLAIKNKLFPAHLSEKFCEVNLDVFNQRKKFTKKQPENGMLKLALNGVYGDSNQKYSFFYDPQYTLSITINGQLLLCMLAEQLMKIPGLKMIQANTDGITYLCPNEYVEHTRVIQKWWEDLTKLELEEVEYNKMFIRDVNSYMAEKMDGKIKRIGAYCHVTAAEDPSTRELPWHKDFSSIVVAKAAEAALIKGVNIEQFILNHDNVNDFMLRTKVPRSSYLVMKNDSMWGDVKMGEIESRLQNIIRFYPSLTGGALAKIMPPTDKEKEAWYIGDHYMHEDTRAYIVKKPGVKPPSGKYKLVENPNRVRPDKTERILVGQKTKDCSNMDDFNREDIDYEYFIKEARKIVDPLFGNKM